MASVSSRAVLLPAEHGAWSLVLEPVVLGLLIAPSWPGATLGLATLAAFLARQPLRILASDLLRQRSAPRTAVAAAWGLGLACLALGLLVVAWRAGARASFPPLALAAALVLVQFGYDVRNRGKQLVPEVAGASAPGALASALLLARGWSTHVALTLWVLLALRALSSVLYVRTRLRRDRGQHPDARPVWGSHLVGLFVVALASAAGLAPWLAAAAFALLVARAAVSLLGRPRPLSPRVLGFRELGVGIVFMALLAAGYRLGL